MRRRVFVATVCGILLCCPWSSQAQRTAMPVLGFVNSGSAAERTQELKAFLDGLREVGFVDGQNVLIAYRWADGRYDRLPTLYSELIAQKVALIAATGGSNAAIAAKKATSTIPVVFTMAGDPVRLGVVSSLSRPTGNVTGVTNIGLSLEQKRLELLNELLPSARKIAYLVNPSNPNTEPRRREFEAAAASLGKQPTILQAVAGTDFQNLFERSREQRIDALVILNDALYVNYRRDIIAAANRHKIPTIYPFREFAVDGGLLSYGADLGDTYRKAGVYVGRILNGARPSALPILQLDKFNLILNAKTARHLGLKPPPSFLARVDEIID